MSRKEGQNAAEGDSFQFGKSITSTTRRGKCFWQRGAKNWQLCHMHHLITKKYTCCFLGLFLHASINLKNDLMKLGHVWPNLRCHNLNMYAPCLSQFLRRFVE